MISVPLPEFPTKKVKRPESSKAEPAPSTVTVPAEPGLLPMAVPPVLIVPPFWSVSAPVPPSPTINPLVSAPGAAITALPVPIHVFEPDTGTPLDQLPAVNQFPAVAPFHCVVCARAGDAPASASAISDGAASSPVCSASRRAAALRLTAAIPFPQEPAITCA